MNTTPTIPTSTLQLVSQTTLTRAVRKESEKLMTASTERIPSMKMIYVNTASLARPGVGSSAIAGDGSIRSTRMSNGLIGMIIISAVLAAIALILITCYLMLRYCNRPSRNTKNNAALPDFYSSADVIPYPKRIYELQAEEGCYSCPPSLDGRSANLQNLSSTSIASIKDGCTDEKPRSCTLKRTIREIETGTLNKAKLSKWPSTSDCQQKSRDNQADKGNLKENKKRHLSKSSIVLSSPS